jgi:beta-glucosidase
LWGTATASYQVEGAVNEGGRGQSIWDTFARTPGRVLHGDTGDVACDHFHLWEQDLDLMQEMGLNAYRLSIAWPRVQPSGVGKSNREGIDFYKRLLEGLRARGVAPAVTLYHWDLPQVLEDDGGWLNRDTALRFGDYAALVVGELKDYADLWITLNEPWVSAYLGYGLGVHAPGHSDLSEAVTAAHHLLLAHGLGARAARQELGEAGQIGVTLNLHTCYPGTERPEDVAATARVEEYCNDWFLEPVLRGRYPELLKGIFSGTGWEAALRAGDLEIIAAPIDFLGVNYYYPHVILATDNPVVPKGRGFPTVLRAVEDGSRPWARTGAGWPIHAPGLAELLVELHKKYDGVPLYVTENGAAYGDYVGPDGRVMDTERVQYLEDHIAAVHNALSAGVDLRGYFCWSFMDNFEWAAGYSQRFGLVWVDYPSQRRIVKSSGRWYGGVASANVLTRCDTSST